MREILMADSINSFEKIMGRAWLEENLKLIKAGHGGGVAFGRGVEPSMNVPMAAYHWYRAREEMALGEITGEAKFGSNSLITAAIGADLQLLEQVEGFPLLVQKLKSNDQPLTAQGQLCIASGYLRENCNITIKIEYSIAARGERQIAYIVKHANEFQNNENNKNWFMKNSIIYIFIGNIEHDVNQLLFNWSPPRSVLEAALKYNTCLVTCGMAIEKENNRPVLVRKGRLLESFNSRGLNSLIYIPNEKIYIHVAGPAPAKKNE
ncbi:hypothetical protein [Desulfotruncus alcoholivorax]|uniref:hypothetical protein n=1 Tax=Desulfotruncus alcoholivorax TaxID=265477 RepID=UPI0003FD4555|nr:hypothetical protein [Desulfotruncus alcoholivorax]